MCKLNKQLQEDNKLLIQENIMLKETLRQSLEVVKVLQTIIEKMKEGIQ